MQTPGAESTSSSSVLEIERIRYFHDQTFAGILAGALVLSLTVWANADQAPAWTWQIGLLALYATTAVRAYLYWQYWRAPSSRSPFAWGRAQTLCAGSAGACWGLVNTSMCSQLPLENQLMIVAVAAVSASYAAAEGFAYTPTSRWFILPSLIPMTLWFYAGDDRLQVTLAVLLTIFIPLTLRQMHQRSLAFDESLRLRFDNEMLAKALGQQKEIAERAALAKSRFLAVASHDLRQPMQALTIYHELLRSEMTLTAQGQKYYERLRQATAAVSDLLNHLLDISRLDSGAVPVEHRAFPLAHLFSELRSEFEPAANHKGLQLRIAPCHALVNSDPLLLGQLLRNLLANAVRYTASGKVLLGCRRHDGQIRIEVWDTGIGIEPDQQEAIFTEFYQVGNQQRDRQQGLGLGLAIVSRLARMLDTHVQVYSRPGQGSCFALTLPSGTTADEKAAPASSSGSDTLQAKRVILIENEEIVRHSLQALLEGMGCQVISGASSHEVLRRIGPSHPPVDVIISDFGISQEETGFDAIERLRRQLGGACRALLITGNTSPTIAQQARQAQLPILHKPVSPDSLRQMLLALTADPASDQPPTHQNHSTGG